MYQQIDWQIQKFNWIPADENDIITVTINGVVSSRQAYQDPTDPVNVWSISPTPFEIRTGTEVVFAYTSTGVGVKPPNQTVQLVDPSTLSTGLQYCTVYDVYKLFGSDNVNKWADLNNERDINAIAEAIIDQIVQATDYVNTKMRTKLYAVPFASPYPIQIVEITRTWAGTNLQVNRGIDDQDETFDAKRQKAETLLRGILAGQIVLNAVENGGDPIPDPDPPEFEAELWEILTYDYDKRSNIIVSETYEEIGKVVTPIRPAGLYEVKFSISYTFADVNDSAYARFRINGGTWYEFVSEPRDATDRIGAVYFFPFEQDADGIQDIELEMRKEDAQASTLTVNYADVVYQRVGGGTPAVNP